VQPDAVLTAAGTLHIDGALHQFLIQPLGEFAFGRNRRVDEVGDVEVTVADMPHDVVRHAGHSGRLGSRRHALGQLRNRHAGVGAHGAAAGLHLRTGEVGVVASGPELGALFRRGRPLEAGAAELAGDVLHRGGLLLHAGVTAMEFHQQHRRLGQRELVVPVHGPHRVRVEQLAAGNRNAHLDDLDRGAHRRIDARKGAGRGRDRFGQRVQAQRDLGHHAQRALTAHHQPRQVVAGR